MSEQEVAAEIDAIASLLPERHDNDKEHSLTRGDLILIARLVRIIVKAMPCSGGLSQEEFSLLKQASKIINRALATIGAAVILGTCHLFFGIFSKGFWVSVAKRLSLE